MLGRLEVFVGVFWLISDGAWLMEWRYLNYSASAAAIMFAIAMLCYQERALLPQLVSAADICWLLMNSLWAVGDMANPTITWLITSAKLFFLASVVLLFVAFWNCRTGRDFLRLVLGRLRLLRSLSGERLR